MRLEKVGLIPITQAAALLLRGLWAPRVRIVLLALLPRPRPR